MKKIPLTQGKFALVNDEDYEELSKYKWGFTHGYAKRSGPRPKQEKIYMHRVVIGAKHGQMVDHINGDKTDNRKNNLRFSTKSTNGMNRGKNKNNTSGFKGVFLAKGRGKKCWYARIWKNRMCYFLGYYYSPEEASMSYENAAKKYHGEFASI